MDGAGGIRARQLADLGARVVTVDGSGPKAFAAPDASADVVIACWSAFRGAPSEEIDQAERLLRPNGRLLVVHDYGRDDVARLRGERPEYGPWSRRDGPFLQKGFKIRVIHCFWSFESLEEARTFLADAFGEVGRMWAGDVPFGADSGWQGTVGGGLRIGFPAGSRGVARIDLAVPTSNFSLGNAVFRVALVDVLGLRGEIEDPQMMRSRRITVGPDAFTRLPVR